MRRVRSAGAGPRPLDALPMPLGRAGESPGEPETNGGSPPRAARREVPEARLPFAGPAVSVPVHARSVRAVVACYASGIVTPKGRAVPVRPFAAGLGCRLS